MSLILVASSLLLATTVSARYTLPASCTAFINSFENCGGETLRGSTVTADYEKFNKCFCLDPKFPDIAQSCFDEVDLNEDLGLSTAQALETVQSLCKSIADTLSSGRESLRSGAAEGPAPTTAPVTAPTTATATDPSVHACISVDNSLSACGRVVASDITSANVANCFCKNGLPSAVGGCFSYLVTASPSEASNIAILNEGYCEKYATGGAEGSSSTTVPSDSSQPKASGPVETAPGSGNANIFYLVVGSILVGFLLIVPMFL